MDGGGDAGGSVLARANPSSAGSGAGGSGGGLHPSLHGHGERQIVAARVNPAVACMHPPPHGHDKRQIPTELAALEQRRQRGSDIL